MHDWEPLFSLKPMKDKLLCYSLLIPMMAVSLWIVAIHAYVAVVLAVRMFVAIGNELTSGF